MFANKVDLVEENNLITELSFQDEYDSMNNSTKTITIENGVKTKVIFCKIEYY